MIVLKKFFDHFWPHGGHHKVSKSCFLHFYISVQRNNSKIMALSYSTPKITLYKIFKKLGTFIQVLVMGVGKGREIGQKLRLLKKVLEIWSK